MVCLMNLCGLCSIVVYDIFNLKLVVKKAVLQKIKMTKFLNSGKNKSSACFKNATNEVTTLSRERKEKSCVCKNTK